MAAAEGCRTYTCSVNEPHAYVLAGMAPCVRKHFSVVEYSIAQGVRHMGLSWVTSWLQGAFHARLHAFYTRLCAAEPWCAGCHSTPFVACHGPICRPQAHVWQTGQLSADSTKTPAHTIQIKIHTTYKQVAYEEVIMGKFMVRATETGSRFNLLATNGQVMATSQTYK